MNKRFLYVFLFKVKVVRGVPRSEQVRILADRDNVAIVHNDTTANQLNFSI